MITKKGGRGLSGQEREVVWSKQGLVGQGGGYQEQKRRRLSSQKKKGVIRSKKKGRKRGTWQTKRDTWSKKGVISDMVNGWWENSQ